MSGVGVLAQIDRGAALVGDRCVLALDIGGTKLDAGVVASSGEILARSRCATPAHGTSGEMWSAITRLFDEVRIAAGSPAIAAVGCGTGGPMSAGGASVSPLNITAWSDEPVRARLAELAGAPSHVDNDAKALALAEGWLGSAKGHDNYLAMVVSTGVGGGIVLDGRLLDGTDGNAGHIGHVVVEPDGRPCACGGRGCLEAEASGTAVAAASGRPAAEATVEVRRRTGRMVGRAVASVANLLDLQLAAVGGSVALGFGADFFEAAQMEAGSRARLAFSESLRIVPVGCGPDGPLLGAGAVALVGLAGESGGRADSFRSR